MGKYKSKRNKNKNAENEATKPVKPKPDYIVDARDKPEEELSNATFEQYYKAIGITQTQDEWDSFMRSLRTPLPTTFRVTGSRAVAQELNGVVQDVYVPFLSDVVFEGQKLDPPRQLPWYPEGLAWQVDIKKQHIRKSPEFRKFQNFLVYENEAGNVSRQEAVSMIPPLLLDVKPHHVVLDTCAAPGSKSGQILEAMHTAAEGDAPPTGLFIANDSDIKRCHMLVHQALGRIGSPNMMVTNLDATMIPTLKTQKPGAAKGVTTSLQYDRILTDVPCTGDGTMRKNMLIWRHWTTGNAVGLHPLQIRIASRAVQMLKPGGRMVYSTCSLNPIENEAVVSAILEAFPDLSLVDVSDQLPELKRNPGMLSWKVLNRECQELHQSDKPQTWGDKKKAMPATMWPNGKEAERHLERCLRISPELQNTGGFFVAVLEKQAKPGQESDEVVPDPVEDPIEVEEEPTETVLLPTEPVASGSTKRALSPSAEDGPNVKKPKADTLNADSTPAVLPVAEESASKQKKGKGERKSKKEREQEKDMGAGRPFKEEPFSYISPDDEQLGRCINFFGLTSDFDTSGCMVRNWTGEANRNVFATSPSVRDLVQNNDFQKMRLVSCGVKVFARQDLSKVDVYQCKWRVVNDGLSYLKRYLGPKKIVKGDKAALKILMEEMYPGNRMFSETFQAEVAKQDFGSFILQIDPVEDDTSLKEPLFLPLWRAPNSIALMVEKKEKAALSMRLFDVDLFAENVKRRAEASSSKDKPDTPQVDAEQVIEETSAEAVEADIES